MGHSTGKGKYKGGQKLARISRQTTVSAAKDDFDLSFNFKQLRLRYPSAIKHTSRYGKGLYDNELESQSEQNTNTQKGNLTDYTKRDENNNAYIERRLNDFTNSSNNDREKLRIELEGKISEVAQKVDATYNQLDKKATKTFAGVVLGIAATLFVSLFVYALAENSKIKDDIHNVSTKLEGVKVNQEHIAKDLDAIDVEIRTCNSKLDNKQDKPHKTK